MKRTALSVLLALFASTDAVTIVSYTDIDNEEDSKDEFGSIVIVDKNNNFIQTNSTYDPPSSSGYKTYMNPEEIEKEEYMRQMVDQYEKKQEQEKERTLKAVWSDGLHHTPDGRKWLPYNGQEVSDSKYLTITDDPPAPPGTKYKTYMNPEEIDEEQYMKRMVDEYEKRQEMEKERQLKSVWSDGLHHTPDGRKWLPYNGQEVSDSKYLQLSLVDPPTKAPAPGVITDDLKEELRKDKQADKKNKKEQVEQKKKWEEGEKKQDQLESSTNQKKKDIVANDQEELKNSHGTLCKLGADGLLHSPDGKRWTQDDGKIVNGANDFHQKKKLTYGNGKTRQQVTQIDVETLEEKTIREKEIDQAKKDSQTYQKMHQQEIVKGQLMSDGLYHQSNGTVFDQNGKQVRGINSH